MGYGCSHKLVIFVCHNWDYLDIDNLVEELEGLNKSNKRGCTAVVALTHFFKWKLQPQFRSGSWRVL